MLAHAKNNAILFGMLARLVYNIEQDRQTFLFLMQQS